MKRIWLALITVAAFSVCAAAQQSLADAAREAKKDRKPVGKVYDNDNLPTTATISQSGPTSAPDKKAGDAKADAGAADAASGDEADKGKLEARFRSQAADLKKEINQLSRELDVMQREHGLRAAAFYGDAGTRLRDEKKWADDERKYQAELADKQKALADSKAKLDDLREQARKAGVPASATE
ncbi:MAG TPA: hypothetical protein VFA60_05015 [Terriglobales bacterium]|nr:hypothetical protein [Terriglobales bacterium]